MFFPRGVRGTTTTDAGWSSPVARQAHNLKVIGSNRDHPLIGGSCRLSKGRVDIRDPVKSIPKPGAERAIVDCAADLEQQVSANS